MEYEYQIWLCFISDQTMYVKRVLYLYLLFIYTTLLSRSSFLNLAICDPNTNSPISLPIVLHELREKYNKYLKMINLYTC